MKLVDLSVKRPVGVTMIVIALIILGMVSLGRLAIDFLPNMRLPYAAVITTYEGAGPQEVESMVTKPIESAVAMTEGLKRMQSVSGSGISMVMAEFDWGTDMNFTVQDMREQIDMLSSMLPDGVGKPMVMKLDISMMPVAVVAFTGDQDLASLKQTAEDVVLPRLERIEGVASVSVIGGYEREIQILIDPVKMQGYGVSLDTVTQMLRAGNLNLSAGTVDEGRREFIVRVPGEYADLHDIARIAVPTPAGGMVRIMDFAEVRDGYRDAAQRSRLNQQDSLAFVIQKQPTANTVQVMQGARAVFAELEKELPGNVQFRTAFDQAEFVEQSIGNLWSDILVGGTLAALVIFFFLRSLRSTLVICTAIPVALISACTLIYFSGETLNMLTLGGLALGVGIIVDDAIVVLENIYRHRQGGLGIIEAARQGASEVSRAVTGATLVSMSVFVPIVFVEGLASEIFSPLALTVAFALGASLLTSLTLIPMLSSRILRVGTAQRGPKFVRRALTLFEAVMERLNATYRRALEWALRNRRKVVGGAAAIFIGSVALLPVVGTEFLPASDEGLVQVTVSLPIGTGIDETDRVTQEIERLVMSVPEVETVFVTVGAGSHEEQSGFGGASPHQAMIDIMLVGAGERSRSSEEVADWLRSALPEIPDAEIEVSASSQMMSMEGGAPLMVMLKGDDLDTLARIGDEAVDIIAGIPGTRDVQSSLSEGRPEIQVLVDRDRAAQYGLSVAQVASTIRTSIEGSVATRYKVGGEELDVRVQFTEAARKNMADLENLTMTTPMGSSVLLRDLARFEIGEGPTSITRMDQARTVVISAALSGRDLGSVTNDVRSALERFPLPPGYRFEFTGEAQEMAEAFGNLTVALVLAIALVYIIMAVQFESYLFPFVVMFSVPVSLTGMVLGLLLTGRTFSVISFIGAIVTVGVVVKNAIVLIDYVNILRERGMSCREAVVTAGPIRLRPILMTALTTILAMFPLALGIGEGSEMQAPLATVVIGGLLFSTLISLVLVPTVYTVFDDWGQALKRRRQRKSEKPVEA